MAEARPRRWALYAPWIGFGLLVVAWSAYWLAARGEAERRLGAWAAAQRVLGAEVGYERLAASGYPLRLSFTAANVVYSPPDRAYRLSTDRLQVHVSLTDPGHIIVHPKAAIAVATPAWAGRLEARSAAVSGRWTGAGAVRRASLEADGVMWTPARGPAARVDHILAHARPDPRAPARLQVAADAKGLDLGAAHPRLPALGATIAEVHVRFTRPLEAASAPADVEGLGFVWGTMKGTGTGRFAFDGHGGLEASLDLAVEGATGGPSQIRLESAGGDWRVSPRP